LKEMSPVTVAVLAGLAFAMAWLVASVSYSYLTGGDVSPSTLVGAAVAGAVFGALNYLSGRRS
jgi:hypothetical protein